MSAGNMELIEVFSYAGPIPQTPEMILRSGRLFEPGCYTLYLDAGLLGGESFATYKMPDSGYDWEKIASAHLDAQFPSLKATVTFDCEADLFSMRSKAKKPLRDFALAFHSIVSDTDTFEEFLCGLCAQFA